MMSILDYVIKSQVVLLILYLFYAVVLHRKISFTVSRICILSIIPLSFLLPLMAIPIADNFYVGVTAYLPKVLVASFQEDTAPLAGEDVSWKKVLWAVYFIGFLFCVIRLGWQLFRGFKLLYKGKFEHIGGSDILIVSKSRSAFSLFGKTVIGECHLGNPDLVQIIRHEELHRRFFHSADLLFVAFLKTVFWFNPLIRHLERSLREVHEYQVDESMIVSGVNPYRYSVLLLNFEAECALPLLANRFSYATLKGRIRMMAKKPGAKSNFRLLLFVPLLLGVGLLVCVVPSGAAQTIMPETISGIAGESMVAEEVIPFAVCPVKPRFQNGDQNDFTHWVFEKVRYPEAAKKAGITGRVTLQFTVGKNGKVCDVRVLRGVHQSLDNEALRVVSLSPDWEPGRNKNGNPIDVRFTFPVIFSLR